MSHLNETSFCFSQERERGREREIRNAIISSHRCSALSLFHLFQTVALHTREQQMKIQWHMSVNNYLSGYLGTTEVHIFKRVINADGNIRIIAHKLSLHRYIDNKLRRDP